MANYPTFKLEGAEKELLKTVFSTKMWDVSQMPSKLYLHTGHGILKAIRPKFFVMVRCNHEHVEDTHEIFGFEMAGEEGIQTVRVNTYNGPSILFASPEDFDYWRTTGRAAYQIPTCGVTDILRKNEYEWDITGLRLWHNNLGTPAHRSGFGFRVWIDRDGMHADHEPFHQSYGNLYKTREECVANLPTVVVSDFDDDEPEPDVIMDATNGHEAELVRRINDAWDKYREEFYPILCALYARDIEEIFQSDAFAWQTDATQEWVLGEMKAQWDFYAPNYLQHIADNQDLSTILHFLNYGNR